MQLLVASMLRELDENYGLDLKTVGLIISSGKTLPREEILAHMLEWTQGFDSEFDEAKYFPRLEALVKIVRAMWPDPQWHDILAQALINPLPATADPPRRSIASLIQADDFAAISRIEQALSQN